jgi:hypothetical protein
MKNQPVIALAPVLVSLTALLLTGCAAGNQNRASARSSGTTASPVATSPASGAGASESASEYCALAGPANAALAASAEANGDTPAGAQLKTNLEEALAKAPAEIKGDVQVMADIEIPILDGKVPQDQIEKHVGDPRMQNAVRHIAEWSRAHCSAVSTNP